MVAKSCHSALEGIDVHYWEGGTGFPILMLHGVGPGTSIIGNFEPTIGPLMERYHILASDLIGFGDSGRKSDQPYFDVELWIRQGIALLDLLPPGQCGIAGHSMGGALALKIAAASDRVTHVLTSSTVGTCYPITHALDAFWSLPDDKKKLRTVMADMVGKPTAITDAMIEGRWELLSQDGYAEYFGEMFAAPRQRYIDAGRVTDYECRKLNMRGVNISMLHGNDDKPCPAGLTTIELAKQLPEATVTLIEGCGHNLPREATTEYLEAAHNLFG
ncbi:MAG: 2-hydroxymuconate semialdehyde hydrolase [Alphaproteobacteria bacterium MarineAlpha11_Bin1]|nr:MAG: 2-hydroxymuconate semialdehyde hydrolase [Alphaproteobacteria bacterium MarineAlpha11_Bin1]